MTNALPAEIDTSPEATMARIEAAFAPGTLADKKAELEQLRANGDTMLFDGAVDWTLFLSDSERRMSGYALSLDEAFEDIIACLTLAEGSEDAKSEVICAVSNADADEDQDGDADNLMIDIADGDGAE